MSITNLGYRLIRRVEAEGPLSISTLKLRHSAYLLDAALTSLRHSGRAWVADGKLVVAEREIKPGPARGEARGVLTAALKKHGPLSISDLAVVGGTSRTTSVRIVGLMHRAAPKEVHIHSYKLIGAVWQAVYAHGNMPDIDKPSKPVSMATDGRSSTPEQRAARLEGLTDEQREAKLRNWDNQERYRAKRDERRRVQRQALKEASPDYMLRGVTHKSIFVGGVSPWAGM